MSHRGLVRIRGEVFGEGAMSQAIHGLLMLDVERQVGRSHVDQPMDTLVRYGAGFADRRCHGSPDTPPE